MNNSFVKPPDKYVQCPHCKALIVKKMRISLTKAQCPRCGGEIDVSAKDIMERITKY